ncbi:hypothetical protein [Pyxidicoccus trucidator]|uniref:hypothetical protein n=1 Tax=Pyxidicoccus trucidator TaxID=2709662 RepID=UPI0013DB4EE3|nr:hypothetical protein [Pyxidicoccus trucidator]
MKLRTLALACLAALAACTNTTSEPAEETGEVTSAAVTNRLYATVGDNELSFETLGTFEVRNGVRSLIIRATANRYLSDVYSFVPDDIFGTASIISERRFEIALAEGHELNTVLSGLPLFVSVHTFTGTPRSYTARIVIAPRFFDFRGSSAIWIQEEVNPIYVVQGTTNLLYRGRASVHSDWLTVTAPDGIPSVNGRPSYRLDWGYPGIYQAIDPHTVPLTFSAGGDNGVEWEKTARLVARVTEFEVTDGDAYEVWPPAPCAPAVYTCYHSAPAGTRDFSHCGTYRQVQRCTYASVCEVFPQPFSVTGTDASSLEPARLAWNVGSNPLSWRELTNIDTYATPECPAEPVTVQAVVERLVTDGVLSPRDAGTYTDRSGLAQTFFFADARGAALLAELDAFAGGGPVQAWFYGDEVPCHNCHDFQEWGVLYYPNSGKVILLDGHHGYDS